MKRTPSTERTTWWPMKDGKNIHIRKMEDTHLVNAYKMVLRAFESRRWQVAIEGEAMLGILNGEMAQDSVEAEIQRWGDLHAEEEWPVAAALWKEIERRGMEEALAA